MVDPTTPAPSGRLYWRKSLAECAHIATCRCTWTSKRFHFCYMTHMTLHVFPHQYSHKNSSFFIFFQLSKTSREITFRNNIWWTFINLEQRGVFACWICSSSSRLRPTKTPQTWSFLWEVLKNARFLGFNHQTLRDTDTERFQKKWRTPSADPEVLVMYGHVV